jgi:hydroxyacylglutathione hydrolase
MRVDVMSIVDQRYTTQTNVKQDPLVQKATGKTDPVEVMSKLREMKNSFK